MTVLSYKTSNCSNQLIVRRRDTLEPEIKCTPFVKLESFDRGEQRSYLRLAVPRGSDLESYLLDIQHQLYVFLAQAGLDPAIMIMPFDSERMVLRVKLNMQKARFSHAVDRTELTSYDMQQGCEVAVKMQLSDIWLEPSHGRQQGRSTWR